MDAMSAELPGLLPFRWEANDGPATPRRPEDDVEFGAVGAVAAGTRAGERVARSDRGHPYVSSNWSTQNYFTKRRLGSRSPTDAVPAGALPGNLPTPDRENHAR